jgi:transglutaminase-like putative cysteine protease
MTAPQASRSQAIVATSAPAPSTLRWTLLALGLALLPHFANLVIWVPSMALALGLWRLYLAHHQRPLPGIALLLPLTLAGSLGIMVSYGGLFGQDAGVALLTLMTALKTLEAKSRRDLTLTVYLGYFLCICAFLFSQSIPLATYMPLPLLALTATLIGINHTNGGLTSAQRLKLAGEMLLQAVPVMLIMFVLFPRVPGPLWGIPQATARGVTGLSEDMSPGSISALTRSDAVAFRATFRGAPPPSALLYWRGPVLWHFDGHTWRAGERPALRSQPSRETGTTPVEYTITLEPHDKHWLFVLDRPARIPGIGMLTSDHQVLARQPVRQRLRYDAASHLEYREAGPLDAHSRVRALQLPPYGNPRARALALQWQAENRDPQAIIRQALARFEADFTYTLTPPPLPETDTVDGFLFDTRKGFCEHFASSFVFLMRAAGIPARVVTGYQGGQANPLGDYLIVRQSDAHAWAEVWLEGRGWVRVDPTAAVSPLRVEQGVAAALPATEPLPALARMEMTWLKRLNLGWDALNNGWNQWVLGYNQQRQMEFLTRLSGSRPDWGDMALWLTGLLVLVVGTTAAFLLRSTWPVPDPVQRAWRHFQHKLARAGVAPNVTEGPRDFAERASRRLPHQQAQIRSIVALYERLRYGGPPDDAGIALLQRLVRQFRPR